MKKKFLIFGLLIVVFTFAFTAVGCNSDTAKTPEELIINSYGDKEYKISFHSDGLDAPVSDITYTANNMPNLPTPERLGYIFEGWYLDKDYTKPYSSGILYLYMRDVTLYAKWSKEEFVQDGTYDIEYNAYIVDGSLREGELASTYGYKKLSDDIVANETYIEKSGNRLLLRLQYDCKVLEPASSGDELKSYAVSLASALNDSSVVLYEKADNYTETVKTLYIDIANADITLPIYFNVSTVNWESEGLSDSEREQTKTTYTVSFNISHLIGFSRPFVDANVALDDGYYLARTYTKKEDGGETMLSQYDSVYSYIIAKDGNYTLVKPTLPYFGIIELSLGQLSEKYTANYFYRLATFMPFNVCYEVDPDAVNKNSSGNQDYYPSAYKAGNYKTLTTEFHAATGRTYTVINMGNSVKKHFIIAGSPTGFPEAAVDLGNVNTLLKLDYEHIIKLNAIDYEPLSGDSFQFEEDFVHYAGSVSDVNSSGKAYDATEKYGLSTQMINYFFTTTGLNTSYESRTVYDSKITVTPSAAANANTVANSRYSLAEFKVTNQIYGYDSQKVTAADEKLYVDSMTVSMFTNANMREYTEKHIGKTFAKGDRVSLASVFAEKCCSTEDFRIVSFAAYKLSGGRPDFDAPVNIDGYFSLNEEVAVLFSWGKDNDRRTSLVEIAFESEPSVTVAKDENGWRQSPDSNNVYITDKVFSMNESVAFPNVSYSWGEIKNGTFISSYYESEMFPGERGVNPISVCLYTLENGTYCLNKVNRETLTFQITKTYEMIVYELRNQYGERKYIYFECNSEKSDNSEYTVTDSEYDDGYVFNSGKIIFDDYGDKNPIKVSIGDYLTKENADILLSRNYYYHSGNVCLPFNLMSYTVYTEQGMISGNLTAMTESEIHKIVNYAFGGGYAFIVLNYTKEDDNLTVVYVANVSFGGSKNFEAYTHADWFTGYEYNFIKPTVFGANGQALSDITVSVNKYAAANSTQFINPYLARESYTLTLSGKQYYLSFSQTGKYRLSYTFRYRLPNGNNIVIDLKQDIFVSDGKGEVRITYVTDEAHPFSEDIMKSATAYTFASGAKGWAYTVPYSLTGSIATLGSTAFENAQSDRLFGWAVGEKDSPSMDSNILAGNSVSDFITKFNQKDVCLYAIWDKGITVTTEGEGVETQSRKYYLSDDGLYHIRLGDFRAIAPALYEFIGWTGGFIGAEIKTGNVSVALPDGISGEALDKFCTITAEFREQLIVGYYINSEYSSSFFRNETVLNGYYIKSIPSPIGKNGYTFIGWYMVTEYDVNGKPTEIATDATDLKKQAITTDMTNTLTSTANGSYKTVKYVAVFENSEGMRVW